MTSTLGRRPQAVVVLVVLVLILLLALCSSQWQRSGTRTGRATVDVAAASPLVLEGWSDETLRPGSTRSMDLRMTNPYDRAVVLTDLIVTVTSVDAPQATASRPCTVADFRTVPSRLDSLVLPPRATTTLQATGIDRDRWPSVTMINTDQNQDGCRRAALTLSLQAVGDFG